VNTALKQRSDALASAITRTLSLQPFFGSFLYSKLKLVESYDVPTAGTDGERVIFNPDFMATMTLDERVFVVCHEVFHAMLMHMPRFKLWTERGYGPDGKPVNHQLMNVAADYIINATLLASKVGQMPKGGLFRHDIDGTMLLEDVYKKLAAEQQQGGQGSGEGQGQPGEDQQPGEGHGGFDQHMMPPGEGMDEGEVRTAIHAAKQTAKMMGRMPAALEAALGEIMEPKVAWEEQLRREMTATSGHDDRTWSRPNRRRLALHDMYFPRSSGFETGGVCVVIDTSGSCSDLEVARFISELSGIMSTCKPEWIKVLWTDAKVQHIDEPEEPEDLPFLKRHGRGGTDIEAALRHIDKEAWMPETVVILTDGYTCFDRKDEDNAYKVIWGMTTDKRAPYGVNIHVEVTP
jgi:predicted metal-dependent peptidase